MLEKIEKNMIFDAHFHYFHCKKLGICDFPTDWRGISCAHSREEWEVQKAAPSSVLHSYGMHPQNAGYENIKESADFLENLAKSKEIIAIGEAGFDYFSEEFRTYKKEQEEIWNIQLDLALKYELPLVVHCRKANEKLFEYSKKLSKIREVLFHSFMGTPIEGKSLLNKGLNAYFSFGKQVFNNNKKVISCIKELPHERILAETDAPYQFLKGEKFTRPDEIVKVVEEIRKLQCK